MEITLPWPELVCCIFVAFGGGALTLLALAFTFFSVSTSIAERILCATVATVGILIAAVPVAAVFFGSQWTLTACLGATFVEGVGVLAVALWMGATNSHKTAMARNGTFALIVVGLALAAIPVIPMVRNMTVL